MTYEVKYVENNRPEGSTNNTQIISSVRGYNKALKAGEVKTGTAFKRATEPLFPYPSCPGQSFEEYAAESEYNRKQVEEARRMEAQWNAENPWMPI